ncbi:MAG: hypothetical protein Q9228_008083, partial [Teloschistes exilis]
LSLGEPATLDVEKFVTVEQPVVWKIRGNSPKPPTVQAGKGEKISILKNWNERFKPQASQSKDKVVIEQQLEDDDEGYDDDPVYYEDGEDCETLRLPDGSTLPHDVRSMLRDQLLTLSPLDGPDPEDQIEDHISTLPNNTRKRKLSISPDPAPEPISAQTLPSSKCSKGTDQLRKDSRTLYTTNQTLDAVTQQSGSTNHTHTKTFHPPHKRKPSASPEPQPEPVLGNGLPERKRAKHSIPPNETLPVARMENSRTPPPKAKRGRKREMSSTTEELLNDPAPKRLKSKVSGHDSASASAETDIEATVKNAPLPIKARSPAKIQKESSKPMAAVPERRSTR